VLPTWDRMHVALPFGRGVFIWGEPIEIEHDLDEAGIERARQYVETQMLDMVAVAEGRVGHGPVPVAVPGSDGPPRLAAGKRR